MMIPKPGIESSADLRQLLFERSRDFRDIPPVCLRPQPAEKWLASSALQKAIRRGNREVAAVAAETLLCVDGQYLWRRLPTICLEDVGYGNRLLSAVVLEASRSSIFRGKVGERQVMHCLVDAMASSIKCRALTDLLMLDTSKPPRAHDWYRHIDRLDLPFLDSYLARFGFSAAGLGIQVPKLLQIMPADVTVITNDPDPYGDELIAGLPASALDKHCLPGRRAFSYFRKSCPDARRFFAQHPNLDPVKSLGIVVFLIESAHLDRELDWPGRSELYQQAVHRDFRAYGMTVQQGTALQLIARANRHKLNECKRSINPVLPLLP